MNEIYARALECYVKKLEDDNKMLRDFGNKVRSIIFDFDGANPDKSDKDIVNAIIRLVHIYEGELDE